MDQHLAQVVDAHFTQLTNPTLQTGVKEITEQLKRLYTNPASVPALSHIALSSPEPAKRQLAAVELRKQVAEHWTPTNFSQEMRNQIKQAFLQRILAESTVPIRRALACVISVIASNEVGRTDGQGAWPELLEFLNACCHSPDVLQREIGFFVISELLSPMDMDEGEAVDVVETMGVTTEQLYVLFAAAVQDTQSLNVQVSAVVGFKMLAVRRKLSDDMKTKIKNLVPQVINIIQAALTAQNDEAVLDCIDVFDDLAIIAPWTIRPWFQNIVEFFLTIASNHDCANSVRNSALNCVHWSDVRKKAKNVNPKILPYLVERLMLIAAHPSEDQDDDEDHTAELDDDDVDMDEDPAENAIKMIDFLARSENSKRIFPTVMEYSTKFVQGAAPGPRIAAVKAIAVCVEGCATYMRKMLDQIFTLAYTCSSDKDARVRKEAFVCFGYLLNEFDDQRIRYMEQLLRLFSTGLADPSPMVIREAVNSLDQLLRSSPDDDSEVQAALPFLQTIFMKLHDILKKSKPFTQEQALSCLGTVAKFFGKNFDPYFPTSVEIVAHFLGMNETEFVLKGAAIDTLGCLADAVGKEKFAPLLPKSMATALELSQPNQEPMIRESAFVFFSAVANIFREEFGPYLPAVLQVLFAWLNEEDQADAALSQRLRDNPDENVNDVLQDMYRNMNELDAFGSEEKSTPLQILGDLADYSGTIFIPHYEAAFGMANKMMEHDSETVRRTAILTSFRLLNSLVMVNYNQDYKWVPGFPVANPLPQHIREITSKVMDTAVQILDEDEDPNIVIEVLADITDALKTMGPALVENHVAQLAHGLIAIFKRKAKCQEEILDEDDEDFPVNQDESELAGVLINNAFEVLVPLSKALGPNFLPLMSTMHPLIMSYYTAEHDVPERSMAIGTLASIAFELGPHVRSVAQPILEDAIRVLTDSEDSVRSDAAFCVGALAQGCGELLVPMYPRMLTALHPLFTRQGVEPNAVDNACGAVARMIMACPSAVPLQQVLPLFLSVLPLQSDFAENKTVYAALFGLVRQQNPVALQAIKEIINAAASTLLMGDKNMDKETRFNLGGLVRDLQAAGLLQSVIQGLSPEQVQALYSTAA